MQQKQQNTQNLVQNNKSCKIYFKINNNNKVYFTGDFDTGNLQTVQQISSYYYKIKIGYDKIKYSTKHTFFNFKIYGFQSCIVKFIIQPINILNKIIQNQQQLLLQQWYHPVVRTNNISIPIKIKNQCKIYQNNNGQIQLYFQYTFNKDLWVEFSFTYPYFYQDGQNMIEKYHKKYSNHQQIYYYDQILCYSNENRKIHLISISQRINCTNKKCQFVQDIFPQWKDRPYYINKPIIMMTARVHPGQTPSSFTLQGALEFLLDQNDYRSYLLRKNFLILIIPMVNPDGVYHGMFRNDINGHNLNRLYRNCDRKKHPSIWSIRKLINSLNNISFFFDFHAHPSCKGFFLYGNAFEQFTQQVEAQVFSKILEMNCPYFETLDCIYSQKQMNSKNKKDNNESKQGCARVYVHKLTNIIHSYTVQCGYYKPNKLNPINAVNNINQTFGCYRYKSNWQIGYNEQYTIESYKCMGKNILISILDLFNINPYSRLSQNPSIILKNLRRLQAQRIYHQTDRFRLIDSNCNKKIKNIQIILQQNYYYQHFQQYGLKIIKNVDIQQCKKQRYIHIPIYREKNRKLSVNGIVKQQIEKVDKNDEQNEQVYQRIQRSKTINLLPYVYYKKELQSKKSSIINLLEKSRLKIHQSKEKDDNMKVILEKKKKNDIIKYKCLYKYKSCVKHESNMLSKQKLQGLLFNYRIIGQVQNERLNYYMKKQQLIKNVKEQSKKQQINEEKVSIRNIKTIKRASNSKNKISRLQNFIEKQLQINSKINLPSLKKTITQKQ